MKNHELYKNAIDNVLHVMKEITTCI